MTQASQLRILTVDDQMTIRIVLRDNLKRLGVVDITEALDGETALRVLLKEKEPPHLIISDYHMPNMDGLTLLRAIRVHPPLQKVPFIMLTGHADRELVIKARSLGANNYLIKPFTTVSLREKIEMVIGPLT
ncbi:two-component system chemotaxis response regulator CheY [Endobacter medicaginis]|jgi:two-component system, chemotaxis family, chemotaxis protein CheY|uniref:Response regulator n=1 Tax=Endobacter medicaginis TaxID=1181271 RepID=A0A839V0E7_9PROT|nr:response regulator [Endobacter medicaginis]MBB3173001.1 two-component system chemotaxis response regulator CheY [Endobacter medicaginis]MCX5475220.1 response regulator [Endobacter medicaginis]NVN29258.1 response regulator [Endobacter medicaginis]